MPITEQTQIELTESEKERAWFQLHYGPKGLKATPQTSPQIVAAAMGMNERHRKAITEYLNQRLAVHEPQPERVQP